MDEEQNIVSDTPIPPTETPVDDIQNISEPFSNSTLTISFSLILILLIGVGGFLWFQKNSTPVLVEEEDVEEEIQKDQTADWKTYRNEELGFGFKYPPYKLIEEEDNVGEFDGQVRIVQIPRTDSPSPPDFIHRFRIDSTEYDNVEDFLRENGWYDSPYPHYPANVSDIVVDGISGKKVITIERDAIIFVINNGKLYEIWSSYDWVTKSGVLSTFKFIE